MQRVCVTIGTAALALVGFVAACVCCGEPPPPDDRQEQLIADVSRHAPDAPLVVWVGDSTIRQLGQWTYPEIVAGEFLAPAGVESVVRAGLGFTFYQYYCLLGPIVAARPSLVVMVLNLRRMHEIPPSDPGLCRKLSVHAMLDAAWLPLPDVGVSLKRMVVARLLHWPAIRDVRGRMDLAWAKVTLARVQGWKDIGVADDPAHGNGVAAPSADAFVAQWRDNVTPRPGNVHMLAASVHLAHSSGAKVLVVVSPAPVSFLVSRDAWNEPGYRRVIEEYRAVVADAGGELVDLHDAVTLEGFRGGDTGGGSAFTPLDSHPNSLGAVQVAARLGPTIAAMLGLRAR